MKEGWGNGGKTSFSTLHIYKKHWEYVNYLNVFLKLLSSEVNNMT